MVTAGVDDDEHASRTNNIRTHNRLLSHHTTARLEVLRRMLAGVWVFSLSLTLTLATALELRRSVEDRVDVRLDQLGQILEELGRVGAVDVAVVARERDGHLLDHTDHS